MRIYVFNVKLLNFTVTGDFLWQKMSGSDYIQFNPGGSGRFALIWTQSASKGDSAVFCVTDKNGDVLTITIHAY